MEVTVKVKFLAHTGDLLAQRELVLRVEDDICLAIKQITEKSGCPLEKILGVDAGLLINGRSWQSLVQKNVRLKDGDVLAVVPVMGGG
jgi:molybdopterin converting factor small subunit